MSGTRHRALLNHDILDDIFEEFDADDDYDEDFRWVKRPSLARLARVCKVFYLPATRVLWRRFENLLPLFALLPSFTKATEYSTGENKDEMWMLANGASDSDLDRFTAHASHIRYLGYNSWGTRADIDYPLRIIAPSTLIYVARVTGGGPLLPNLRELHYTWSSPASIEILHIIPCNLQGLDIDVYIPSKFTVAQNSDVLRDLETSFRVLLSTVFSLVPNLKSISLSTRQLSMARLSSTLSQLQYLRRFATGSQDEVDIGTLQTLSSLPNLNKLRLYGNVTFSRPISPPAPGFHNLEIMSISQHPERDHLYDFFASPRLVELRVLNYPSHSPHAFRETCAIWARQLPALQRLTCTWARAPAGVQVSSPSDTPQSISHMIEPLLDIGTLTQFSLGAMVPVSQVTITDADLSTIAMAWPRLVQLHLSVRLSVPPSHPDTRPHGSDVSDPGMTGLVILAARCPSLNSLFLPRLAFHGSLSVETYNLPVVGHELESLRVDNVEADNMEAVALLVDRLFPNITIYTVHEPVMGSGVLRLWEIVRAFQEGSQFKTAQSSC